MNKILFKGGLFILIHFIISTELVFGQSKDNSIKINPPVDSFYFNFSHYRINYPSIAKENGIEGKVLISFDVDSNCSLVNRRIMQAIGGGCEEEVMKTLDAAEADLKKRNQNLCKETKNLNHEVRFKLTDSQRNKQ